MSEPIPRSFIQQVVRHGCGRAGLDQAAKQWAPESKVSIPRAYSDEVKAEAQRAYEEAYLSRYEKLSGYMKRAVELECFAWLTGHRWGAELLDTEALGASLLETITGVSDADPRTKEDPVATEVRKFLVAAYRTARRMRPCGFVVSTPEEAAQLTVVRS